MKKTFIMVCAAIALVSCGGKTAPTAGDVVADTVENTTEAAPETEGAQQAAATADSLTAVLDQQVKSADAKSIAKTVADAQATIEQLKKEGKLDEAEAYSSKIKEYVANNKEAITKAAKGDITVSDLVNGIVNLPANLKQSADDAKNAVVSDGNKVATDAKNAVSNTKNAVNAVGSAVKAKAESDAKAAVKAAEDNAKAKVEAAKADAKAKADAAKQKAREAANQKVNDVLNKALGQ